MKILNPTILEDIRDRRPIKLDLGSGGPSGKAGFYSVDLQPLAGVDIVADLNEPLIAIPDNCAAEIFSRHTFEHIGNLIGLITEVHRIGWPGARVEIVVPHFSNVYALSDPTHARFFGIHTMFYFVDKEKQPKRKVPAHYSSARFTIESIHIGFYRHSLLDTLFGSLFGRIFNQSLRWQEFYERRLAGIFHAWQITYVMRVDKPSMDRV